LLKRIRLSIPFMFDELAILDGEENPNGEPLDSPIGCLSVDTFGIGKEFFACYKSGARTDMLASFNPRTPTLEAMLSAH
ncbi:MAG: hypothetical protein WBK28_02050, partial [Minisyncoccia bacterium]